MKKELPSSSESNASYISTLKSLLLSNAAYAEHPFHVSDDQTYVYTITGAGETVCFFGASHSHDPQHPQFADIAKQFELVQPDIVCIEGSAYVNKQPEKVKTFLQTLTPEECKTKGEHWYTLKLAIDAGIAFESPEPSFATEVDYIEQLGYSRKDIFIFYIYRMIDQYIRTHDVPHKDYATEYLQGQVEQFIYECGWDNAEVSMYFAEIIESLNLDNLQLYKDAVTPVPFTNKEQQVTNQISDASSRFRDEHVIERLYALISDYKKVFIVFGSAHAVRLEPVLREMIK